MREQMIALAARAHRHSYNGWTAKIEARYDARLFSVLCELERDGVIEMKAAYVESDYRDDEHDVTIRLSRTL